MSPFAPFTEAQFQYLAMGKARAYSWETLAQQINMPLDVVERVAWTHEKLWRRFLTKAERHIARETISEVAGVLRQDIHNTEPHLHATLTNSLTRVLKLQQEYAPQRRHRERPHTLPAVVPAPITPTPPTLPTNDKPSLGSLPSLGGTVASLLGFFVLLGALLMGCWNNVQHLAERTDDVREPMAVAVERPIELQQVAVSTTTASHERWRPPPWVREPSS